MAKKKYGVGAQVGTGAAAAAAAAGAGWGVGEATKIAPGPKRTAIGLVATAVMAGGLAIFKETRSLAIGAGVGGVAGSAALMVEPAARRMIAERKAAKEIGYDEPIDEGEYEETFSYSPPPMPTTPQAQPGTTVIYEAPKIPKKSTTEIWAGVAGTAIEGLSSAFGSYLGGFGSSGSRGMRFGFGTAGMTFGSQYLEAA